MPDRPAEQVRPAEPGKPSLAVWKFASCDGCQLTLLNCEDELLAIAGSVQIASFTEASSEVIGGPYDLSLVEGSITTPADAERIRRVREASRFLVTIGAGATSGGIQALRNFGADLAPVVYASPQYIDTLRTSTAIADARGCYGCFGPMESPNTAALTAQWRELGADKPTLVRAFRSFTGGAEAFRKEANAQGGRPGRRRMTHAAAGSPSRR